MITNSYFIRQGFKGSIVNQALPCLHGGSLEITLTVPPNLMILKIFYLLRQENGSRRFSVRKNLFKLKDTFPITKNNKNGGLVFKENDY